MIVSLECPFCKERSVVSGFAGAGWAPGTFIDRCRHGHRFIVQEGAAIPVDGRSYDELVK